VPAFGPRLGRLGPNAFGPLHDRVGPWYAGPWWTVPPAGRVDLLEWCGQDEHALACVQVLALGGTPPWEVLTGGVPIDRLDADDRLTVARVISAVSELADQVRAARDNAALAAMFRER